jgi:hypothetical protein
MKMAAKSQPKKGKPAPKKKTSKSVPKKAAATKKSAPPKKAKATATKKSAAPKKAQPAKVKSSAGKRIPLADFVNMTYLTETGVKEWLRRGRLTGLQNESGEWMIDAANLEVPAIKRLVR